MQFESWSTSSGRAQRQHARKPKQPTKSGQPVEVYCEYAIPILQLDHPSTNLALKELHFSDREAPPMCEAEMMT